MNISFDNLILPFGSPWGIFTHSLWIWAMFSACVGSFLTVVSYRLPHILDAKERGEPAGMSLSLPASHCPICGHKLTLRDNVPLLGYVLNRGKCRHCATAISPRYLGLEILATAWGVLCWHLLKAEPSAVVAWSVFGWYLLVAGWIDANTRWLPNTLTWGLLGVGLVSAALSLTGYLGTSFFVAMSSAVIWWIALESLNFTFTIVRGQEGLARGDVWLTAAIAAWIGGFATLLVVIASFICVVVAAVVLREKRSLPLGPSLAVCAIAYSLIKMLGAVPLALR